MSGTSEEKKKEEEEAEEEDSRWTKTTKLASERQTDRGKEGDGETESQVTQTPHS